MRCLVIIFVCFACVFTRPSPVRAQPRDKQGVQRGGIKKASRPSNFIRKGENFPERDTFLRDKKTRVEHERDPFNPSEELLRKTISERYVSFAGGAVGRFNLPKIEITGIMVVGDKIMATANIESLGTVSIKPNDKIVMAASASGSGKRRFDSFIIKVITPDELVIVLEGGYEIRGKFR
ncbi:MAG: hypothetical protein K8S27_03035 [Candidatus Omnitrophica bacterium]|nr:hypothetical protein [Candidatus Omnitrophota bacterium]